VNECSSNPCQHGACFDALNHYHCVCDPGYTGINCEKEKLKNAFYVPSVPGDIDECSNSGCLNGTCIDQLNDFICHCYPGFTGKLCEINVYESFYMFASCYSVTYVQ
ncbi:hypothetical protein KUTeg_009934, partial [Tegillarca granosa]